MRLFLLPGSDGTDAAEDQTDDRPYVQIAVAARAKQADQPCQHIERCADITALAAIAGADGHDAGDQQADGQDQARRAANFGVVFQRVAQPGRAGLQPHQKAKHNADALVVEMFIALW